MPLGYGTNWPVLSIHLSSISSGQQGITHKYVFYFFQALGGFTMAWFKIMQYDDQKVIMICNLVETMCMDRYLWLKKSLITVEHNYYVMSLIIL